MKAEDVIVSTTSQISGWRVAAHLDVVTSHVVTGTNVFSDIFASFSDKFGKRSQAYQHQLREIDAEAVDMVRERAAEKGARAVIGLRINHSPISSDGKNMFMVTASGTAVRVEPISDLARQTAEDVKAGYKDFAENESDWRCRCGSLNETTDELCTNCGRSPEAVI